MLKQAAAWVVLALAGQANALTLGPAQGQILIGHPLDLRLRAEGVGADADGITCLEAELFYGDSRVPASTVTLTLLPVDTAGASASRVRASPAVNEPLVTLLVSMGCSDRYTRSYQLLADQDPVTLAMERGSDPAPGQVIARLPAPEAGPTGATDTEPAEAILPPPDAMPALPQRALRARPVEVERAKPRQVRARAASTASAASTTPTRPLRVRPTPSATPRLELELIETPVSAGPGAGLVAAAASGSSQGTAAGSARPEAAPAATPEQAVATPQEAQLQQMARELEAMRSEQARMLTVVESVNAQLAQAAVSRWQDTLVLGLLGSSAASLLGLLLAWVRLRRERHA